MATKKRDISLTHIRVGLDSEDIKAVRQLAAAHGLTPDAFIIQSVRFAIERLQDTPKPYNYKPVDVKPAPPPVTPEQRRRNALMENLANTAMLLEMRK